MFSLLLCLDLHLYDSILVHALCLSHIIFLSHTQLVLLVDHMRVNLELHLFVISSVLLQLHLLYPQPPPFLCVLQLEDCALNFMSGSLVLELSVLSIHDLLLLDLIVEEVA